MKHALYLVAGYFAAKTAWAAYQAYKAGSESDGTITLSNYLAPQVLFSIAKYELTHPIEWR